MSYGYSSTYPRVPNSTPQLPPSIRPPIHNPYDKFTQPQFDEWIGGITTALRKALGQEEEAPVSQRTKPREGGEHPVADIDDDSVGDSFAEWRAVRTKEKGKMRATEREQDSEYGRSQETYGDPGVQDHPAGHTPSDAIELLSDEDDAEDEKTNGPEVYDNESYDGGLVGNSGSPKSGSELQRPVSASSQLASPSKLHDFFTNATGQEAIEISDGETEEHDQGNDFPDPENVFFGWGQEEEGQQIPDVHDPWQLPKTHAEDLYTGGPIRGPDRARLSPSHLTPVSEDANYYIDPQLRPSSTLVSKPTDHNRAQVSRSSATPTLIPSVMDEANGDDEVSVYAEDAMEPDTPTGATPRDEPDFISFTALNQPSDIDSERVEPDILYISENDGRESSTDDEEAEEDEFDEDGPVPLGTSDLEIPAEPKLDEDREEELDELEDDDEPIPEVPINPPYGYYGLDASSVTGSGGLDDEVKTAEPPSDPPKGDQGEALSAGVSQEAASMFDHCDLAPLPAATALIEIDHRLRSTVSIDDTTKISLAGVSLASLDGVVAGKEDGDNADEDAVGDDTVLIDEAVLTINEVEEVLRHAFAAADQSASSASEQGTALVSDVAPSFEEPTESTPQKSDLSGTTPEIITGEGQPPHEPSIEGVGRSPIEPSQSTTKNKLLSQEQRQPLPFVMPLVANPNVRDPMSAPWSPAQSSPPTPVASLAYLPAVTKFKRDNQLLGTANTSSGLFTPLEGSGSSSPSPSDDTTPEELDPDVETEITVVEEDEKHPEEQATSVLASQTTTLPETAEVEPEAVPAGLSEGDGWGDIPRLPTPPTERKDTPTGPVTRVFFQPEAPGDMGGLDARTEADRDGDALPALVVGTPREGNGNTAGLGDVKPLLHTMHDADLPEVTNDPFKLMGNNSTVAPGAATNDDDGSSIASSPPDEERTPRLKSPETSASIIGDPQTAESVHPEIQLTPRSPIRIQGNTLTPAETRKNLRKRKRSGPTLANLEDPGSRSTANGKVLDAVTTSLGEEERDEVERELTGDELRDRAGEHGSDNESFTSSLVAPRNVDPTSQDGSRASSIVSEQPLLLQGHSPVSEDAPVFHGHGKFKAALQALKALRRERHRSRELEPETEKVEEKRQEKERPIAVKMGSRKSSENRSDVNTETNFLPSLILAEVSAQPSLPSASTSQSPKTPTSALPPPSPTVITAPVEVAPPPHQERTAQEPAEPDREVTQKPTAKAVKRTVSRKRVPIERRSTRSQCRYHKISLPREENGPRVTFCVPQCSISNKELMEEEDITDDGLATVRDFDRLWDQIEEKDLSPYLIGTIRQLVGVDLVRENEIYYLPTEADVKRMERKKKWERRKSRKSIGGAASVEGSNIAGRPDSVSTTGSASQVEKGKVGPPPSFAESISTVSTRPKIGQEGSIRSISEDEVSNGEGGERAPKRRRVGRDGDGGSRRNTPSVPDDSAAPSTAGSPVPSQSTIERTPVRRPRRALRKAKSVDVQAYKPPISSGGESSEDEAENVKARRKSGRGGMKGLKRRRPDFIVTCDGTMPVVSRDRDGPPSPISTRSKRAKMDEK